MRLTLKGLIIKTIFSSMKENNLSLERLERLQSLKIDVESSLLDGMRQMDQEGTKLLVVVSEGGYRGLLSAGDIQRALIEFNDFSMLVRDALRSEVRVAKCTMTFDEIRAVMMSHRTEFMPVLDENEELVDVHFWSDTFASTKPKLNQIDVPVVVMAGGKGTRLKPFSNIIPKPLFPLGEKTILEEILDRFKAQGCQRFFLSVNHKAEFIKSYLGGLEDVDYNISYFQEDKPLGTAGSLHLIKDRVNGAFIVSNCDILLDADFSEILDYHNRNENSITMVSAVKYIKIPYGTLTTEEGGLLKELREKPELTYLINTGVYILDSSVLEHIPENEFYHITTLVEDVQGAGGQVGVYPVSEKSWADIGEWQEYGRTLRLLGMGE